MIDYACGAGHFLTEAVEAVNAVRGENDNTWVEKHIYGVEKDYRLARVSKISLFMNGAGGANIIFGDGLENYKDKGIENGAFDVLVANPPYSVSGFKQHLKLRNNVFRLFDIVTNDGKEIETLFVERIAQLLRPQGLAAVVLPASILSNSSSSYIAAREELLQNFHLHAIVSFGSKTFGATGTNTVTLFLERYNEPPRVAELTKDSVDAIMSGEDLTDFTDKQLLDDYLTMQKVSEADYTHFVRKEMDGEDVHTHPYFKVYADAFGQMPISLPKKCSAEEEERILREKFYDFALRIEREKLYYFALVREQQTLVITAPSDNKEQKTFLGYDWSNRKGAEGIVEISKGGKLYDPDSRSARGTLASAIRNSFAGEAPMLSDDLMKYAKTYWLKDMMDWSRCEFDKGIATSTKKAIILTSRYDLVELQQLIDITRGVTYSKEEQSGQETPYVILTADNITEDGHFDVKKKVFLKTDKSLSKDKKLSKGDCFMCFSSGSEKHVGKVCYIENDTNFYAGGFMGILRTNGDKVLPKYIAYILNSPVVRQSIVNSNNGSNIKNLSNKIGYIKIPLPPQDVQQQIVKECEAIDDEYNTSRMTIETYRKKIQDIFERLEVANMGGYLD